MKEPQAPGDVTVALAARVEALRIAYERFMMGLDRIEPAALRQQVVKELRRVLARPPNNTAQNFRLQAIKARLFTYEALWDRHLAARENSQAPRGQNSPAPAAAVQAPSMRTDGPTAAALTQPAQPSPLQQLYRAYVAAHANTPQATPPTWAAFETMVAQQTKSIKERTGWQEVGLRVITSQGRPALQAFNGAPKAKPG